MTATTSPPKKSPVKKKGSQAAGTKAPLPAPDQGPRVEPRIEARRALVKADADRRQRRTIVALVIVTLVAVGAMIFVQSSWLDVDQIVISGAARSDLFEVRDATEIQNGDALLELDLRQAGQNVERLPWVESAWVERTLDGTVTIYVKERVPIAAIPTSEALVLVDTSGRQLEVVTERPPGFMKIEGIEATGEVGTPAPPSAQAVMHLVAELKPQLQVEVERIYFDETEDLYLDLRVGGRVLLGTDSGLTEKLVSLQTILDRVDLRCLWQIDLRVPSAPALIRQSAEGEIGASLTNLAECS